MQFVPHQTFGLPAPPSFEKIDRTGDTNYPTAAVDWGVEERLDVEWVRASAPAASSTRSLLSCTLPAFHIVQVGHEPADVGGPPLDNFDGLVQGRVVLAQQAEDIHRIDDVRQRVAEFVSQGCQKDVRFSSASANVSASAAAILRVPSGPSGRTATWQSTAVFGLRPSAGSRHRLPTGGCRPCGRASVHPPSGRLARPSAVHVQVRLALHPIGLYQPSPERNARGLSRVFLAGTQLAML